MSIQADLDNSMLARIAILEDSHKELLRGQVQLRLAVEDNTTVTAAIKEDTAGMVSLLDDLGGAFRIFKRLAYLVKPVAILSSGIITYMSWANIKIFLAWLIK